MSEIKKTMLSVDGNTAAALGSYNYIEVAGIYPIFSAIGEDGVIG